MSSYVETSSTSQARNGGCGMCNNNGVASECICARCGVVSASLCSSCSSKSTELFGPVQATPEDTKPLDNTTSCSTPKVMHSCLCQPFLAGLANAERYEDALKIIHAGSCLDVAVARRRCLLTRRDSDLTAALQGFASHEKFALYAAMFEGVVKWCVPNNSTFLALVTKGEPFSTFQKRLTNHGLPPSINCWEVAFCAATWCDRAMFEWIKGVPYAEEARMLVAKPAALWALLGFDQKAQIDLSDPPKPGALIFYRKTTEQQKKEFEANLQKKKDLLTKERSGLQDSELRKQELPQLIKNEQAQGAKLKLQTELKNIDRKISYQKTLVANREKELIFTEQTYPDHVAISLGNGIVISNWSEPHNSNTPVWTTLTLEDTPLLKGCEAFVGPHLARPD